MRLPVLVEPLDKGEVGERVSDLGGLNGCIDAQIAHIGLHLIGLVVRGRDNVHRGPAALEPVHELGAGLLEARDRRGHTK